MILQCFLSKTVREVCAVRKHYVRLLSAQRDILALVAIAEVTVKLEEMEEAIAVLKS